MNDTEISSEPQQTQGKTAIEYVAEAIEKDIELIDTIKGYTAKKLYAALFKAVHGAIIETQTIAFVAKNKDDFYKSNIKYIMILSIYQELLNKMLPKLKDVKFDSDTYVEQNRQLFVIMISKLFMLIKRADIYFEDPVHYKEFRAMLPVQMFIDNVVTPKEKSQSVSSAQ